jgi:hypothetical protein
VSAVVAGSSPRRPTIAGHHHSFSTWRLMASSVPPEYAEFAKEMIEHETSIEEFASLEAAGETDRSIGRVATQLIYPLSKPD